MHKIANIAILGRANVGKSSLFNRLSFSNTAIVDDRPGITRDRIFARCKLDQDYEMRLMDTAGFEELFAKMENKKNFDKENLSQESLLKSLSWQQSKAAIQEADLILFVVDVLAGVLPEDEYLFREFQKFNKAFILVANKSDGVELESYANEFYAWGVDEIVCVSAKHKIGLPQLKTKITQKLMSLGFSPTLTQQNETQQQEQDLNSEEAASTSSSEIKLAILGRPNVGKSSLLNRLSGENRALVSDIPGTTRDPIDIKIRYQNCDFTIIDTAGVRKRMRVQDRIESVSMIRSMNSMEQSDVVVMVLTAEDQTLTEQDARLCSMIAAKGKPVLIVVNKWDLHPNKDSNSAKNFERELRLHLGTLSYAPIIFVSAVENQRVRKILDIAIELHAENHKRVGTAKWNEILQLAVQQHTPAVNKQHGKRIKFYYATQIEVAPPTTVVFCNIAGDVHESYQRYLLNRFRDELGFTRVPLRILYKPKHRKKEVESSAETTAN